MRGKISSILLSLLFIISCKENALFISGEDSIGVVNLELFEKIEVKDVFEIVLVSDTTNFIIITCGENLLKNIEIKQQEKLISLYNNNKYHWSRDYKKVILEIHATDLKSIVIREPITLTTDGIYKNRSINIVDWSKISIVDMNVDVEHFSLGVSSNNTGEYTIKGKTNTSYFRAWGSCFYFADELIANECTVKHDGIGDVYINVKNKLTAKINTYGNIYYKGSPEEITSEKLSTGSLIKLD